MLDELDRELERRGHRFVRYADDSNIYVRSVRAGQRVMGSATTYLTEKHKLKVNGERSAVAKPWERKLQGFSVTSQTEPRRRIAPKAPRRFKERVRELTRRNRGVSLESMVEELSTYLRGWRSYYCYCQTPSVLESLGSWIRRRLRSVVCKQWKRGRNRFAQLVRRGVLPIIAATAAGQTHGPWRMAHSKAMATALPNAYFDSLGLPRLASRAA